MSTPFDVRAWARQAGIQTTGGFAVVAECVTLDELQRFAEIAISHAAKQYAERDTALLRRALVAMRRGHFAVADHCPHRDVMDYNAVMDEIEERLK